jgi:hypothetical protein
MALARVLFVQDIQSSRLFLTLGQCLLRQVVTNGDVSTVITCIEYHPTQLFGILMA